MKQCPKCLRWYLNRQSLCEDCDESLLANEVSSEDADDGVFGEQEKKRRKE